MTDQIDPRRAALLVMDYQNGIVDMLGEPTTCSRGPRKRSPPPPRRRARRLRPSRVRGRRPRGDPAHEPDGRAREISADALRNDSPNTAVHDRVAPQAGDMIVREVLVGAFSTTDLDAQLRERGVDTVILAGISTSGVVLSTVRDASDRDYRVLVVSDATADPDEEVHAFLTERIFPRQADVVTVGELEGLAVGVTANVSLGAAQAGDVLPDRFRHRYRREQYDRSHLGADCDHDRGVVAVLGESEQDAGLGDGQRDSEPTAIATAPSASKPTTRSPALATASRSASAAHSHHPRGDRVQWEQRADRRYFVISSRGIAVGALRRRRESPPRRRSV